MRPAAPMPPAPSRQMQSITYFCHCGHLFPHHPPALSELPHLRGREACSQEAEVLLRRAPNLCRCPGSQGRADVGVDLAVGSHFNSAPCFLLRIGPPGLSSQRGSWTSPPGPPDHKDTGSERPCLPVTYENCALTRPQTAWRLQEQRRAGRQRRPKVPCRVSEPGSGYTLHAL